ncbi:MAG: PTS transporter subunit EIIA, partial [Fuerstiella sp.]|nr:PTS transporter subunit EIIA [Fuerstiella sp.]
FSSDSSCLLDISADSIKDLIPQVVGRLVNQKHLPESERDQIVDQLIQRESIVSTAIGHSVAVPHCYLQSLTGQQVVFVRLNRGIDLGAPDGTPTRYFFFLFGSADNAAGHLDTLALIARLMSDDEFRYDLGRGTTFRDLNQSLERAAARSSAPVQSQPKISVGLQRTGRLCGGIIADIQRRLPCYTSDLKDGIHTKSIASIMFLFFACLAPAVTFGGLMADATGGAIGAVEMILASSVCGFIFALLAGQPPL